MSKFEKIEFYTKKKHTYQLLPFRFTDLDETRHVLATMAGEFLVLDKTEVPKIIRHELSESDPTYTKLRSRHFLIDDKTSIAPELLGIKLRTRLNKLPSFTALHMFVVTLRCEHSCPYCQVSRQSEDKIAFDMSEETAKKSIELALKSPSTEIKIEFQGGEPLLNFPIIKYIVLEAKKQNKQNKNIQFVIATNLAMINDEILNFCKEHDINISTSLDGPQQLHNSNRPRAGNDSFEKTVDGIKKVRDALGRQQVSALMTTTFSSLKQVKLIIDTYLEQKFDGIFLRPLSPYGFAIKTKSFASYGLTSWLQFYKEGLEYIIELNKTGVEFREYYACTILAKMLTSNDPGYVDLMSPSGIGIAAAVYNYDGAIYASDESRMLVEMGDDHFKIGDVNLNSYEEVFGNENLLNAIEDSFAFSNPMCNDCAYEHYCGADPVYHYAIGKDYVGRKPSSDHCNRNMFIFKLLISKMEEDPFVKRLFTNWANGK